MSEAHIARYTGNVKQAQWVIALAAWAAFACVVTAAARRRATAA
jgi:hypothetical protein